MARVLYLSERQRQYARWKGSGYDSQWAPDLSPQDERDELDLAYLDHLEAQDASAWSFVADLADKGMYG